MEKSYLSSYLTMENSYLSRSLFYEFALFGISHSTEHFDTQVSQIEELCRVDGKVMMLELPPNYEELVQKGILRKNCAMKLAERFRPRCARIIAGDQEVTIPENPDWVLSLVMGENYLYPNNQREGIMGQNILKERPDIVIVGNGLSNMIKEYFPNAHYTVFEVKGGYGNYQWDRPDNIITL